MMRPNARVEKVYLYPKPVDFRKSIDGLAALVDSVSKSRCLTLCSLFS
ncbi:IS66 Orf2 like protein [Pseudomonas sp. SJZ101]|nr:IS66 Orf2 like protein [Pseudomonas sp. SJZ075]TWC26703.1 IS66 Orf2 like protein [Pseudomonas sp. SJZ078]TWC45840.1 IS66 Orf2 like protein [Pseudomonas sp. SJZ124]TWC46103.1 IS66 Orf2 like protein [Pseudomonas sp. SJZ080]TWC81145.1 IS66 Orf2 like protein [Pseudomonas sp. SJZ101]